MVRDESGRLALVNMVGPFYGSRFCSVTQTEVLTAITVLSLASSYFFSLNSCINLGTKYLPGDIILQSGAYYEKHEQDSFCTGRAGG